MLKDICFDTLLNLKLKPYLWLGYLAQPGLKMAVNMGCANVLAEEDEMLFGTTVAPED